MFIKFILSLLLCSSAVYSQYGWDDDDFRVPGSMFSRYAIIEQLADDEGLEIYGFADMSSMYLKLFIDASGDAWITAYNNINIASDNENVYVRLGDAVGVKAFIVEDSGGNDVAFINSDGEGYFAGDVGIGTTSPSEKLEINGALMLNQSGRQVIKDGQGSGGLFRLQGNLDSRYLDINTETTTTTFDAYGSGAADAHSMVLIVEGNEIIRLKETGFVGIGTDNPSNLLDVGNKIAISSSETIYFASDNGGTSNPGAIIEGVQVGTWGTRLDFHSRDGAGALMKNIMSISGEDGNVGIGTDSPGKKLTVQTGVDNDGILLNNAAGAERGRVAIGTEDDAYFQLLDATNVVTILLRTDGDSFFNGGNVGIGEESPGSKLDINGSIDFNSVAVGAETAIEAVVDLQDLQGAVINSQLPAAISRTSIYASDWVHSVNPYWSGGHQGLGTSGTPITFTNGDGNIVTVIGGLITDISAP